MPCCFIERCHNRSEKGFRLFNLPQGKLNETRRKEWLKNMRRKNADVESKCVRLCEVCLAKYGEYCNDRQWAHFESTEFEQHRKDGKRKLKPNAIPTIFPGRPPVKRRKAPHPRGQCEAFEKKQVSSSDHDHAYTPKKSAKELDADLDLEQDRDAVQPAGDEQKDDAPTAYRSSGTVLVPVTLQQVSILEPVRDVQTAITPRVDPALQAKYGLEPFPILPAPNMQLFRAVPTTVPRAIKPAACNAMDPKEILKRKCALLRRQCQKLEQEKRNITENLRKFLNQDQIDKLAKKSTRGSRWSLDTLQHGIELFLVCGPKGYDLLLSKGYPLPSRRTLRKRLRIISIDGNFAENELGPFSLDIYNSLMLDNENDSGGDDNEDINESNEQFLEDEIGFIS